MAVDVFTISSNNYLGMARVFADSFLKHHPGSRVSVCLVDQPDERVASEDFPFDIILAEDLGMPDFRNIAFRYNVLELNTAVKPFVFKYLRDDRGLDRAFYFDPDILVHDRLVALEDALESHQAVLTPHITEPIDNRHRPPERFIGMCGVYNLGFVGLQLNDGTRGFLDWWCERLARFCVIDLASGLFVDQSWMDFAPAYLDSVAIVREPIFNVAYWNLPHRRPVLVDDHWEIDGRRVGFFHFSGVDIDDIESISRHQDRIDLWSRPELEPLFENYRGLVQQSGQPDFRKISYGYGCFAGTEIEIPQIARVAFQATDPTGLRWPDPFLVEGDDSFLAWLTEPLLLDDQVVNRTALYLWSERPDIREEFPDLRGGHLRQYLEWFVSFGAGDAQLHDIFVDPIRSALSEVDSDSFDTEVNDVAKIDLSNPGENTAWLNQPADDLTDPVITRLAMIIHRVRPDVALRYPEPLGSHRMEFAYWIVSEGGHSYRLHSRLLDPIRQTLPLRSRVSSRLRNLASRLAGGRRSSPITLGPPVSKVESLLPSKPMQPVGPVAQSKVHQELQPYLKSRATVGVNVVGFFEGEKGARGFAPVIRDALRASGLPCAEVALDNVHPDQMTSYRYRYGKGVPFPVTVLAIPSESWVRFLWSLPLSNWLGTKVIGYCSEIKDTLASKDAKWVDEVWTPTENMTRLMADQLPVPVRTVPPTLIEPTESDTQPQKLDPNRFWFLTVDGGPGEEHEQAVSAAIECFRRLARNGNSQVGLCLAVEPRKRTFERQLKHLPIHVVTEPMTSRHLDRLLTACDGLLDLHPNPRVDRIHAKAAMHGMPVVAAWAEQGLVVHGVSNDGAARPSEPEDKGGFIDLAVAAMCAAAETRELARERIDQPGKEMREASEAGQKTVLWAQEVRRLLHEPAAEITVDQRKKNASRDEDARVEDATDSSSENRR